MAINQSIEEDWKKLWAPPERMDLPTFAIRYVKIGKKKADFNLDLFPWAREPMLRIPDFKVPQQAQIWAAQLGKGRCAEAAVPYFAAQEPGDLTWFGSTNEKAKEYAEERLMPILRNCDPVKPLLPECRHDSRKTAIHFAHMVAEVLGANETNTQSRTRSIIFCDEAWQWDPGMLASAISRTSAPDLVGRRKVIITSTAGDEDSDLERFWATSTQHVWQAMCPLCDNAHPFALSRETCKRVPESVPVFTLTWDENETTRPGKGQWDMEAVKKTVRMHCPSCKREFAETPEIMRSMRKSGHYRQMNMLASSEKMAFWVPRMPAGEWAGLIEKYLRVEDERRMGIEDSWREFLLKDLAEKFSPGAGGTIDVRPTRDYEIADPPESFSWDKEALRFLTVDRQAREPYFWFVVQAWSVNGESRIVEVGHRDSKEEIEYIAEKHGLVGPKSVCVHVDCAFDGHSKEDHGDTWAWCAGNKWYALRGDDAMGFAHQRKDGKPAMKYYSPNIPRHVGRGTTKYSLCFEVMWSNLSVKNFLSRLKSGKGLYYGIPRNVPDYFLLHMDSEYRREIRSGRKIIHRWEIRGKQPNHLWDCACMQVVAAFRANLIPIGEAAEVEPVIKLELES